jgi:transposase
MKRLSEDTRLNVIALLSDGCSHVDISKRLGVSVGAIHNIRSKHLPDLEKSVGGRKRKLSEQDKRRCVRLITSCEVETATRVSKMMENEVGVSASRQTVARALKECGMESAEKQKKPALSSKNIKERLAFAQRHKDWTVDDWERVIWSDETKIARFGSDGRSWCWVRDGGSLSDRQVKQTRKHGGGSVMVWGCMTAHGPGFLCKIEGWMDQHLYKSILEDELASTIEHYSLKEDSVIFQHDNDPKHMAKSVQEWLNNQAFHILEWPPQSPDLNPIEHLWSHLKRQLNNYETPARGMLELWERIESQWNSIDKETCMNLINSMPERIEAVIKARGKWTKY